MTQRKRSHDIKQLGTSRKGQVDAEECFLPLLRLFGLFGNRGRFGRSRFGSAPNTIPRASGSGTPGGWFGSPGAGGFGMFGRGLPPMGGGIRGGPFAQDPGAGFSPFWGSSVKNQGNQGDSINIWNLIGKIPFFF